jgi:hypothetical protein
MSLVMSAGELGDGAGSGLRAAVGGDGLGAAVTVWEEQPWVALLSRARWHERCAACFQQQAAAAPPLQKCTRCEVVWYCCRRCQDDDWADHRHECATLARLGEEGRAETLEADLLLGRLARRELAVAATEPYQLMSHVDGFSAELQADTEVQLPFIRSLWQDGARAEDVAGKQASPQDLDGAMLQELFGRYCTNRCGCGR